MKTISSYLLLLLSAAIFLSCQDQHVRLHTIINEDGTCIRAVSYSNVMPQAQRDSAWGQGNIGWSQPLPECLNIRAFHDSHTDVGAGDTVTTTFRHLFDNAEEMAEQMPLMLNGSTLKSRAQLKRRFRWFYTEYDFTETIAGLADSFPLPFADVQILSYWFTGEPNLIAGLTGAEAAERLSEMETKVTRWLNDNFCQITFDFIARHYDSIPAPPVPRDRFVQLQDSLARYLMKDGADILLGNAELSQLMHDFFRSDAYAPFFDDETPMGKELNDELTQRLAIFALAVPYTLQMPGTVIDTGSGTLRPDGIILYPFTGERLIPHDYVIHATSRVSHPWAYAVALLILLLAVGMFFKKKSPFGG